MNDWPLAVHEAGHATAAVLLGATVGAGPCTIVPAGPFDGLCVTGTAPRYHPDDVPLLRTPWPLLPARLRRWHETTVMVLLAGEVAAEVHAGRGCPVPEPEPAVECPEPDSEPAPAVVLPRREQAQLEAAAADPGRSDLSRAMAGLEGLHGRVDLAEKHARFLAAETEALMAGPRARRMVLALAAELTRSRTLPARRWRTILAGTR